MKTNKKLELVARFDAALNAADDKGVRVRVKVKGEYRYTFAHGPIINSNGRSVIGCNGISGLQELRNLQIVTENEDAEVKTAYYEAAPNKMFPPALTALLRFAETATPLPCASCGKKRKKFWTMLCPFSVPTVCQFVISNDRQSLDPLTLVCRDHFMSPSKPILHALKGGDPKQS